MKNPLIVGILALTCALGPVVQTASAQPDRRPRAEHPQHRRQPPPPGWDRRQWEYRQRYERTHPRRRKDDRHEEVIAGLFGFVLGAALAESREEQRDQVRLEDRQWIAACARKYRSFDARSGTYLGRDGLRHYCRL